MAKVMINVLQDFNGKKEKKLFEKDKQYEMEQARVDEILAYSNSLIEVVEDKPAARKPRAKKVVKDTAKDGE